MLTWRTRARLRGQCRRRHLEETVALLGGTWDDEVEIHTGDDGDTAFVESIVVLEVVRVRSEGRDTPEGRDTTRTLSKDHGGCKRERRGGGS